MTDEQPPNCESCQYKPSFGHIKSECPFDGYDYTPHQLLCITMRAGCVHHPDTKAWMMRGVLMELERRRGIISMRRDETSVYLLQGDTSEARMYAIDAAIALIKGDGK